MDTRTLLGGGVVVAVTPPATLGVASLADAGMALPVDLSEVVTACMAPLADAGLVTIGVTGLADAGAASLADAGMVLPADPAGVVTVGVASLADAGSAAVGVADEGVLLHAAPVAVVNGSEYSGDLVCGAIRRRSEFGRNLIV